MMCFKCCKRQKNNQIQNSERNLAGLRTSLAAKKEEQDNSLKNAIDAVYEFKKENEEYFKESMTGFLKPKESFFNKCKEEQSNSEELLTIDALIERHNAIYKSELISIDTIPSLSLNDLSDLESNPIFSEPIVGRSESQIATLIKELQNGDWLHNGLEYLKKTETICPFCQQRITQESKQKLKIFLTKLIKASWLN